MVTFTQKTRIIKWFASTCIHPLSVWHPLWKVDSKQCFAFMQTHMQINASKANKV
jgi:hypothetical protein